MAGEIDDVAPERDLAPKAISFDLARAHQSPDGHLSFGHILPQGSGAIMGAGDGMLFHFQGLRRCITPSQPSPIEGELYTCQTRLKIWNPGRAPEGFEPTFARPHDRSLRSRL